MQKVDSIEEGPISNRSTVLFTNNNDRNENYILC